MTDARLYVHARAPGGDRRAERMRRGRLAYAGDVVVLSLDGHQRRAVDGGGPYRALAAPGHLAARQLVLLEDAGDGLQVILGRNIHDRQVIVVEAAAALGALLVSSEQVAIELPVRVRVPRGIQGDERGELQEAWIDL